MKIAVTGTEETGWELVDAELIEPLGVCEKMDYLEALDCFMANWPEHRDQLEDLRKEHVEFFGEPVSGTRKREKAAGGMKKKKKRGSEARFRELIMMGKTNEECVRIVKEEFPESNATLSNAAWNRAQLRKNPSGFAPDGTRA
jgi:hypothetical protein